MSKMPTKNSRMYKCVTSKTRESRLGGFLNPENNRWQNWKPLSQEDKDFEKLDKRTEQEKLLDEKIALRKKTKNKGRFVPFH